MSNQNNSTDNDHSENNEDVIFYTASSWSNFWKKIYLSGKQSHLKKLEFDSTQDDIFLEKLEKTYYEGKKNLQINQFSFFDIFNNVYLKLAFLFSLFVVSVFYFYSEKKELQINISGKEISKENSKEKKMLSKNDYLSKGDKIYIPEDSAVSVKYNDNVSFTFLGSSEFRISELNSSNLKIDLENGTLLYSSKIKEDQLRVTIVTHDSKYEPTGTLARLNVDSKKELLEIESGNFIIQDKITGVEYSVKAGYSLFTDLKSQSKSRNSFVLQKQTLKNLRHLEELIESENLTKIQEKQIQVDIQKPYKKLITLNTKDGKNFTGYVLSDLGDKIILETLNGKVEVEKSNVSSIE